MSLFLLIPLLIVGLLLYTHLGRMGGGGLPKLPLGLDAWLFSAPFAAITYLATEDASTTTVVAVLTILCLVYTTIAKRTGHGSYMTLPFSIKKIGKPEFLDYLLDLFFGRDPRLDTKSNKTALADIRTYGEDKLYIRNITGLVATGVYPVLFTAIVLMVYGYLLSGILLLICGGLKAVGYVIPWKLWPNGEAPWYENGPADRQARSNPDYEYRLLDDYSEPTNFGEAGYAFFTGIGLIIAGFQICGL